MKLECMENQEGVVFKISDYDKKFIPLLEMCFYEKGDGFYYKTFSKATRYMEKIKENFRNHGYDMFMQLGYFKEIPWEEALLRFVERVDGKNIRWWLTGSCAACIRGIPLNPHDVDIMIDSRDIPVLEDIFSEDIFESIRDTNGWLTKDFGVIFLGARVDIASDPSLVLDDPEPVDCGPYALQHLETVEWKGYDIKVPPLQLQLYVNKLRGRYDRVEKIRKFMSGIK